jgi:hypothetical protein
VEHQPAGRRPRFNSFSQRFELNFPLFTLGNDGDEVREASAKAIQPPNDERIAFAK